MIYQYDIRGKKNLPDFDQSLIWSSILLLSFWAGDRLFRFYFYR